MTWKEVTSACEEAIIDLLIVINETKPIVILTSIDIDIIDIDIIIIRWYYLAPEAHWYPLLILTCQWHYLALMVMYVGLASNENGNNDNDNGVAKQWQRSETVMSIRG